MPSIRVHKFFSSVCLHTDIVDKVELTGDSSRRVLSCVGRDESIHRSEEAHYSACDRLDRRVQYAMLCRCGTNSPSSTACFFDTPTNNYIQRAAAPDYFDNNASSCPVRYGTRREGVILECKLDDSAGNRYTPNARTDTGTRTVLTRGFVVTHLRTRTR